MPHIMPMHDWAVQLQHLRCSGDQACSLCCYARVCMPSASQLIARHSGQKYLFSWVFQRPPKARQYRSTTCPRTSVKYCKAAPYCNTRQPCPICRWLSQAAYAGTRVRGCYAAGPHPEPEPGHSDSLSQILRYHPHRQSLSNTSTTQPRPPQSPPTTSTHTTTRAHK